MTPLYRRPLDAGDVVELHELETGYLLVLVSSTTGTTSSGLLGLLELEELGRALARVVARALPPRTPVLGVIDGGRSAHPSGRDVPGRRSRP